MYTVFKEVIIYHGSTHEGVNPALGQVLHPRHQVILLIIISTSIRAGYNKGCPESILIIEGTL